MVTVLACGGEPDVDPLSRDASADVSIADDAATADVVDAGRDARAKDSGTRDAAIADAGALDTGTPDCGASAPVSFSQQVQPIFEAACVSCHPNGGALDLRAGKAWGELVGVSSAACHGARVRVVPNDPNASYLVSKLTYQDLCSGEGMGALTGAQVALVTRWICQGAPNN